MELKEIKIGGIVMNPYDKVNELVRAIKESEQVKEYMKLKEELYKDEKNKEMINLHDL